MGGPKKKISRKKLLRKKIASKLKELIFGFRLSITMPVLPPTPHRHPLADSFRHYSVISFKSTFFTSLPHFFDSAHDNYLRYQPVNGGAFVVLSFLDFFGPDKQQSNQSYQKTQIKQRKLSNF